LFRLGVWAGHKKTAPRACGTVDVSLIRQHSTRGLWLK